jgi:hypothetical protein
MDVATRTTLLVGFGTAMALFGLYCVARRHVPMQAFSNQRRAKPVLHLRGGPAVLTGLAMVVGGLLIAVPRLPILLRRDSMEPDSTSFMVPVLVIIIGGLAGFAWQVARNVHRLVTSDGVQNQMAENLQRAVRAAREERDRQAEAGIEPE